MFLLWYADLWVSDNAGEGAKVHFGTFLITIIQFEGVVMGHSHVWLKNC